MQQRSFGLIYGLLLVFAGLMLLQQMRGPVQVDNNKAKAAGDNPLGKKAESEGELLDDEESRPVPEGDSRSLPPEKGGEEESAAVPELSENPSDNGERQAAEASGINGPPTFYSLGSLDEDGADRYLVTLSSRGSAIHRVELNARDRRGRLQYRDLDHFGGYLGNLELTTADRGLRVGFVGPGTAAAKAGLEVGDVLVAAEGEPLTSASDLKLLQTKRKTGEQIRLSVLRKGTGPTTEISATLSDQPMELIRPESRPEMDLTSQAAFLFALRALPRNEADPNAEWPLIEAEMASADWIARETEVEGNRAIEFEWNVNDRQLESLGLTGPVTVLRRYWLERLPETDRTVRDKRNFHLKMQIEIRSESAVEQEIAFELDGPTGLPTEGWWYQNKIHGRSSAFFSMAGARDVVSSTSVEAYRFFGQPEIVTNEQKKSGHQLLIDRPANLNIERPGFNYLGVDSQYFHVALLPAVSKANTRPSYSPYSAYAKVVSKRIPETSSSWFLSDQNKSAKILRLVDCSFLMFDRFRVSAGKPFVQTFDVFAGPKEAPLLEAYGLGDNRTFGWFAWMSKSLCWLLGVFYWMTGSFSYGLAIILLTILVRLLVLPISRKAALNAQMMQLLAPEMKAIAEKYKEEPEKRARAQQALFAKHKYNPFGGCFMMFLQLPIFIGLYRGLSVDVALRDKSLIPGMEWCSNLAAPDQLYYWKEFMPSFLGHETGWLGPWFNILPLLTIVLFLVQQKLFTPPPTDDQQKMMQKVMTYMMFFMALMFFKVPSGLCIYFITSSLWGIAERQLLPKPKLSQDKIDSIKKAEGGDVIDVAIRPGKSTDVSTRATEPKSGLAQNLMKRLRDQIEYGEQRPEEQKMDAETRKRLDREREKKRRGK